MAADAASTAIHPARSASALLLFGMIAVASAQESQLREPQAGEIQTQARTEAAEQHLEEIQPAAQVQPPAGQAQAPQAQPAAPEQAQPDTAPQPQTETQDQAPPQSEAGAPSSTEAPAESPPKPSGPGAMEVCAQPQQADESMLERVHRNLAVTACASSAWLDSLFGDQIRYEEYRATSGSVSAGALWSRYDGFDPRLRFRIRLQLPQWDERLTAFAGRVGEENFISDTESDF